MLINYFVNNIQLSQISIIVPVKNNVQGLSKLLHSIFISQEMHMLPREIIVVDNCSNPEIVLEECFYDKDIPVKLLKCERIGPAAARNVGAKIATGKWLFFTDSDCVFTATTLVGYLGVEKNGIAYAGNVTPYKKNFISNYYKSIKLLNPPCIEKSHNHPSYIVTANCLVKKDAFDKVGGFNESFKFASGEDVDIGIRLSKIGILFFAHESIIKHNFEDNLLSFYKRFYRYGSSVPYLEKIHNISIHIESILPKNKFCGSSFVMTKILQFAFKKGKSNGLRK